MSATWTTAQLERWNERIVEKARDLGLDWYTQHFLITDHEDMLELMSRHGFPLMYSHWSFGKEHEILLTRYKYGVTGLPYEMVINSEPSLAYLMSGNSLLLQVLTMAHVYGHNDFFKNNRTFAHTRPHDVVDRFRRAACRVDAYIEDPSIGAQKVEDWLTAARSLMYHRSGNFLNGLTALNRRTPVAEPKPTDDEFADLHAPEEIPEEPELGRVPEEPEQNLLLFVRQHNPFLKDWQRDILSIVDDQACYFIPQIQTKIINEGWATLVHKKIMDELLMDDQGLRLEFMQRHSQVVAPGRGGQLNPYSLGLVIWQDLERRWNDLSDESLQDAPLHGRGWEKCLQVRESDRDSSFLRQYLTTDIMRQFDLFEYEEKREGVVVTDISDEEGWRAVRDHLLRLVGLSDRPVVKVIDANPGRSGELVLQHESDPPRPLDTEYTQHTLRHLYHLWLRPVNLHSTDSEGEPITWRTDDGVTVNAVKTA